MFELKIESTVAASGLRNRPARHRGAEEGADALGPRDPVRRGRPRAHPRESRSGVRVPGFHGNVDTWFGQGRRRGLAPLLRRVDEH
eukprot:3257750-Pyramimonas_sp.AAC.1